jgi:hypothetical protein
VVLLVVTCHHWNHLAFLGLEPSLSLHFAGNLGSVITRSRPFIARMHVVAWPLLCDTAAAAFWRHICLPALFLIKGTPAPVALQVMFVIPGAATSVAVAAAAATTLAATAAASTPAATCVAVAAAAATAAAPAAIAAMTAAAVIVIAASSSVVTIIIIGLLR